MKILGIETSCDETAAAVLEEKNGKISVLSNIVSSQIEIHKKYGGVVPEVAAREHILNILPVINEALIGAGIERKNANKKLDAIAVTAGPGLITSLVIGVETSKTLSYVWQLPIIPVNHIEGHIYANFIGDYKKIKLPAVVLTVSGGHTMLILMKGHDNLKTIGDTRDDAAGEAFDKAAKLMNIGYPGGPAIAKMATKTISATDQINETIKTIDNRLKKAQPPTEENLFQIHLPRPMINSSDYDFSFSGLKTALLYELQKDNNWKSKIPQYSQDFQQAIVDVLVSKTIKAAKQYKVKSVMLAGGVAANTELREQLKNAVGKLNLQYILPDMQFTTDNAAMIASAGIFKAKRSKSFDWKKIKVDCNLKL